MLFYDTVTATAKTLSDPSTAIHLTLDVLGMIPVIGEPADGLNALIYLAEGDEVNAAISAAGMLPIGGMAATGARAVKTAVKTGLEAAAKLAADSASMLKATPPPTAVVKTDVNAITPPTAPVAVAVQPAAKPASSSGQVVPSSTIVKADNPYPRGTEPYKNAESPNGETVVGLYAPGKPYDYIDTAGTRGSSHFDLGDAWDPVTGPVANTKYIEDVIARGDTVHSTVSVSHLCELRDAAVRRGEVAPGDSLLTEWQMLENAGYTWTGPNTLSPPGA